MAGILILILFSAIAGSLVLLSRQLPRPRRLAVLLGAATGIGAVLASDLTGNWSVLLVPVASVFAASLEWSAGSRLGRVVGTGLIALVIAYAAMPTLGLPLYFLLASALSSV